MNPILQQLATMPKARKHHPRHRASALKSCSACGYQMSGADRHARCQTCRRSKSSARGNAQIAVIVLAFALAAVLVATLAHHLPEQEKRLTQAHRPISGDCASWGWTRLPGCEE